MACRGQFDARCRAGAELTLEAERAAVRFDDLFGQREPESKQYRADEDDHERPGAGGQSGEDPVAPRVRMRVVDATVPATP